MAESCWRETTGDADSSSAPLGMRQNVTSPGWIGPIRSLSRTTARRSYSVKKGKPADQATRFIYERPMAHQRFDWETGHRSRWLPMENGLSPAAATTRLTSFFCPLDRESR